MKKLRGRFRRHHGLQLRHQGRRYFDRCQTIQVYNHLHTILSGAKTPIFGVQKPMHQAHAFSSNSGEGAFYDDKIAGIHRLEMLRVCSRHHRADAGEVSVTPVRQPESDASSRP